MTTLISILDEYKSLDLRMDWMSILDDGDDHVVMVEKEHFTIMERTLPIWWTMMGHKLTVEGTVQELCHVEFCQHKPFIGDSRITMCPNPLKVIPKTMSFTRKVGDSPLPYLRTVTMARQYLHNGVPLLGPLFKSLNAQLGPGELVEIDTTEFKALNARMFHLLQDMDAKTLRSLAKEYIEPTENDRFLFAKMWKIDPTTQLHVERLQISTDISDLYNMPPNAGIAQNDEW